MVPRFYYYHLIELICFVDSLQPGTTPEFQLDPLFVTHVIKEKEIFSQLSVAAKTALWIHSSDVFSLMVLSLDFSEILFI